MVGATTTNYVTDADNREVLEYKGTSGALQAWYAFGLGPDEVLNQMNVAGATRATSPRRPWARSSPRSFWDYGDNQTCLIEKSTIPCQDGESVWYCLSEIPMTMLAGLMGG